MIYLDWLSRFAHVATAITLVGGSLFMVAVLHPALGGIAGDPTLKEIMQNVRTAVIGRWKRFVHAGVAVFLLSGIYNYARAVPRHRGESSYHAIMGIKMLLALGVFFLAAALVGRSASLQRIRDNRVFWSAVMLLLAFAIVAMSGWLRVAY